MGILGNKNRLCAAVLSASLLLGIAVVPGCKKKAAPDPKYVSNHDSLDKLNELKKRTEAGVKYSLHGGVSKIDGKTEEYNSFEYEMKEFVNALLEVDMEYVDDWDPGKLTYPVYEISLRTYDSTIDESKMTADQKKEANLAFGFCWSNGYLIAASGDVLECDTDFEKLCECLGERFELDNYGINMRVYSRVSALWHDKWYPENMMPLEDYLKTKILNDSMTITEAEGWNAEFKSMDSERITVTINNVSASMLLYGEKDATVFTKIDGEWYLVPKDPSLTERILYYSTDGLPLFGGESVDLDMRCGYLPKGDYAALVDLSVEGTGHFQYDLAEFTV